MSCSRAALTETNETRDRPDPDDLAAFPAVSFRDVLIGLYRGPGARFAAGIFMRRQCTTPWAVPDVFPGIVRKPARAPVLQGCLNPGTIPGGCSSQPTYPRKRKPL
jgi:hypothetical protein